MGQSDCQYSYTMKDTRSHTHHTHFKRRFKGKKFFYKVKSKARSMFNQKAEAIKLKKKFCYICILEIKTRLLILEIIL